MSLNMLHLCLKSTWRSGTTDSDKIEDIKVYLRSSPLMTVTLDDISRALLSFSMDVHRVDVIRLLLDYWRKTTKVKKIPQILAQMEKDDNALEVLGMIITKLGDDPSYFNLAYIREILATIHYDANRVQALVIMGPVLDCLNHNLISTILDMIYGDDHQVDAIRVIIYRLNVMNKAHTFAFTEIEVKRIITAIIEDVSRVRALHTIKKFLKMEDKRFILQLFKTDQYRETVMEMLNISDENVKKTKSSQKMDIGYDQYYVPITNSHAIDKTKQSGKKRNEMRDVVSKRKKMQALYMESPHHSARALCYWDMEAKDDKDVKKDSIISDLSNQLTKMKEERDLATKLLEISSIDQSKQNTNDDRKCVVCFDGERKILLMECKHLCLCRNCLNKFTEIAKVIRCPICRQNGDTWVEVYI